MHIQEIRVSTLLVPLPENDILKIWHMLKAAHKREKDDPRFKKMKPRFNDDISEPGKKNR